MAYNKFAKYYDLLMYDVDYNEWTNYVLSQIKAVNPSALKGADLACGSAKFTIALKKAGYEVTGMDISAEMLSEARDRAKAQGLDIHFVQQSMTSFDAHTKLDFVTAMCDAVNYLTTREEIIKAFSKVYNQLVEGGAFIFDISSEYKLTEILGNNIFTDDIDDVCYIWQNDFDEKQKLSIMDLTFFVKEEDGRFTKFYEQHKQRAHSVKELTDILDAIGFAKVSVYADLTTNKVKDSTQRIHFVCKK